MFKQSIKTGDLPAYTGMMSSAQENLVPKVNIFGIGLRYFGYRKANVGQNQVICKSVES